MKLYVKNQGKILGPLEWDKILFAVENGRLGKDVTVSDDRVNWLSMDDTRKLLEKSKSIEQKGLEPTAQSSQIRLNSPITPQAGSPGSPQAGYPGSPQAGYPGNPQAGYPGGPQAGYPGSPQAGYPGSPQAGYPGGPQAGYPGGPQAGYPGGPQGMEQMNGVWNNRASINSTDVYRQTPSQTISLGIIISIIAIIVAVGGVGSIFYYMNRNVYTDISRHIDLWLKAVQNDEDVSAYASDLDIPFSPVRWKIVTDKSEFKANKEKYDVKLLMESSNKGGYPIRATWTLVIRRDKNRKTGYVITYVNVK